MIKALTFLSRRNLWMIALMSQNTRGGPDLPLEQLPSFLSGQSVENLKSINEVREIPDFQVTAGDA